MSELFKYQKISKQKSKIFFSKIIKNLSIFLPILFFFFTVWLIFIKFDKSPMATIEEYLSKKQYNSALKIIETQLENDSIARTKWLMYASIVEYAIKQTPQENNKKIHLNTDYFSLLKEEDSSGIFLKESYLRKLQMFNQSPNFIHLLLDFKKNFSISYNLLFSYSFVQAGFISNTIWSSLRNDKEKNFWLDLFHSKTKYTSARLKKIDATNLNLRSQSNIDSEVITQLKKGDEVLIRKKGRHDTIYNYSNNWFFIVTKNFNQGWVFGKYLVKK